MSNPSRREFLRYSCATAMGAAFGSPLLSQSAMGHPRPQKNAVSLALWSLIKSFRQGVWKLTDIARICREDFGIDGIEYVTNFFESPVASQTSSLNGSLPNSAFKVAMTLGRLLAENGNLINLPVPLIPLLMYPNIVRTA